MGDHKRKRTLGPPPRWLHCPRKGTIIVDKFIAFKTPLDSSYDSQIPLECSFSPSMIIGSLSNTKAKIGLWIDLTNTTRFYDKSEVEGRNIKYVKLECRGHGECPNIDQTNTFIRICQQFISQHPLEIIGVHCTHGFNRTGFLIVAYLIESLSWGVEAAVHVFSQARPPGIYKADYLQELFRRYGDINDAPPAPPLPDWCNEMTQRDRNYSKFQRPRRNTQDRRERPEHEWVYNRNRSFNFDNRRPLGNYGDRRRSYHPYGEDYSQWNSNRRRDGTDLPRRPFSRDRNVYPDTRHFAPASADLGRARNAMISPGHIDEPVYRIGTCERSTRYTMGPQESFGKRESNRTKEQSGSRYLDHPAESYSTGQIGQIEREPNHRDPYVHEDRSGEYYSTDQMRREPNYSNTYASRNHSKDYYPIGQIGRQQNYRDTNANGDNSEDYYSTGQMRKEPNY